MLKLCSFRFIKLYILSLCFPFFAFASGPADFLPLDLKQIEEDDVTFSYTNNDGSIALKCAHVFDKPESHDWDVWCGKGTKWLRQFRVHFLIRKFQSRVNTRSSFEVLYWVIDRDQPITKSFSSTGSWIQFKNPTDLEKMSFTQGVENDYAYLTVEFKP